MTNGRGITASGALIWYRRLKLGITRGSVAKATVDQQLSYFVSLKVFGQNYYL